MKKALLLILIFLGYAEFLFAEEIIVFTGVPELKISEGGIYRVPVNLTKDEAIEYKCIITEIDDKYYWKSRENVELVPVIGGAYITFIAGSGYVRIVRPEMEERVRKMGAIFGDPEERFDYVEHLLLGLKSVTYYGKAE